MENSWDYLANLRGTKVSGEWPTIPEIFALSVEKYPERACFTTFSPQKLSLTYAETKKHVDAVADYLILQGLKKGDKVVMTGKNTPYWGVAYLAIAQAGGIIVPIDYQLENDVIERLIDIVEASILFVDKEKFDTLAAASKTVKTKISLSPDKDNFILAIQEATPGKKTHHFKANEHDLAAILFTSGTTGNEKGVMLSHANLMSDTFQACHKMFLDVSHADVWYALLPLHHSYCMTAVFLEGLIHGSEIVFAPRLAVPQIMKDLELGNITMFMGIPLLFNKILQGMMKQVRAKGLFAHILIGTLMRISGFIKKTTGKNPGKKIFASLLKKANLYNIRILICGGGPLAPETFRRYNQLGLDFIQGYGLTETSPILTLNPTYHFKVDSVGKVFPLVDMKILDPDEDGIGEIIVKGPNICSGYYKNKEATEELYTSDGYLRTGDLGYLDKEQYLYLTGRKKSLIVTEGGKNVFPEEIEDYFQLKPEIEQILIRGYLANKETRAEGIEAAVFPNIEHFESLGVLNKEQIAENLAAIVKEVNKELLPYKRIQRIRVLEEAMEMTTTKKIKRLAVDELLNNDTKSYLYNL